MTETKGGCQLHDRKKLIGETPGKFSQGKPQQGKGETLSLWPY